MKSKLLFFMLATCVAYSTLACFPKDEISGPDNVCPGTASYRLAVYEDCHNLTDVQVSNNGTVLNTIGDGFSINWTNNGTAPVQATITTVYQAFNDPCVQFYATKSLTKTVTIQPANLPAPPVPSSVSSSYLGYGKYRLSTSSSGATEFKWVVNGGAIEGSTTTPQITVRANGCSLSGTVKAIKIGDCLARGESSNRSFNHSTPAPPLVESISETILPDNERRLRPDYVDEATGYSWTITNNNGLSFVGGGTSTNSSFGGTVTVICNSTSSSGRVNVRATNNCGQSSQNWINIDCSSSGGGDPGGPLSPGDPALIVYPNPSPGKVKINGENFEHLIIMSENGEIVRDIQIKDSTREIDTSGLPSGVYYFKVYDLNGNEEVRRILIEK